MKAPLVLYRETQRASLQVKEGASISFPEEEEVSEADEPQEVEGSVGRVHTQVWRAGKIRVQEAGKQDPWVKRGSTVNVEHRCLPIKSVLGQQGAIEGGGGWGMITHVFPVSKQCHTGMQGVLL